MAKKKDLDEENINEENQGDINEADDSFGLPDVDYKPLEEEEQAAEEEDLGFENVEEPEEGEEELVSDAEDNEPEVEQEQTEYVPGSYSPPKEESNKAGIVIGVIVFLLIAVAAIWYWGFHLPAEREIAEKARIEKEKQEKIEADRAAAAKAEADRKAQEQAEAEAAAQRAAEEESKAGTIETISARANRYYVVIASAIDGDLAMDYAKKLSETGESVKIIEPYGNVKFYRVAVQDLDTWDDAQSKANELKSTYGDGVWVIKY
ncbi:MAG: SPOR domain-containing protein [Bacteroidota bacterium]